MSEERPNQKKIVQSFQTPDWYFRKFAANIQVRRESVASLLGQRQTISRCLDIGCGDGSISLQLADRVTEFTFIDISDSMLGIVEAQLPAAHRQTASFIHSDFLAADLGGKRFDVIICLGVLAYVSTPKEFLSKLMKCLSDDGILILECTDSSHLISKLDRLFWKLKSPFRSVPFTTYPHTFRAINSLATEAGLRNISSFRYAYGFPILSKFITQENSYRLIRWIYGWYGRSRLRYLGNQVIMLYAKAAE